MSLMTSRRTRQLPRVASATAAIGLLAAAFGLAGGFAAGPRVEAVPDPLPTESAQLAFVSPVPESPPPPPVPPLTPELEALQQSLTSVITSPDFATNSPSVAVAVRDDEGRRVVDVNSDMALLPASTMKLLVAAVALDAFGPDHRITTDVASTLPVDSFGYLAGDLVLQGGGDPVLATDAYGVHVYPSRPRTRLEELADAVAATGLKWIAGNVVADGTAWGGQPLAPGWRDVYLSDHDARRITPMTVDAGLTVAVSIPDTGEVEVLLELADDPAAHAADELARLLRERGIHVTGVGMSAVEPVAASYPVADVASPPLRDLLQFMVQRSDNHIADTLVRHLGHELGGDGSWAGAGQVVRAALHEMDVDVTGVTVLDGSGLSREDRVTAAALADLDAAMARSPHAEVWAGLMAVSGESGTLKRRLAGTHGHGRFYGKTGTLDDVKAVAGFVTDDGQRLHLSVLANDLTGGDRWTVIVLMDELALRLVEYADGCRREPTGQPTEATSPPIVTPYELVCPAAG
jgi:D-alanyl-D-alanine carboxypeptidase/D-alanyl-D-alanine-endopeptidase (penicillin-binding protein 4)